MLSHADICDLVAKAYTVPYTVQAGDNIGAWITQVGDETVVAIKGTVDLQGWVDDFSSWPTNFPIIGTYHDGFGKWGLKLAAMVLPNLPAGGQIVFAGHSLGGALALVLAAAYAAQKLPPARVIVFGCPRGAYATNVTAGPLVRAALELVEYRNHGDPVPNVPPWPMWQHAARGTMLGQPVKMLRSSMADHAITLYQANVRALGAAQKVGAYA